MVWTADSGDNNADIPLLTMVLLSWAFLSRALHNGQINKPSGTDFRGGFKQYLIHVFTQKWGVDPKHNQDMDFWAILSHMTNLYQ